MATIQQIQNGFANYFDNEILLKAPPLKQFQYGIVKGIIIDKMEGFINKWAAKPMIQELGLIEGNQIDIDNIYKWAKGSIQKSGQLIIGGIIFNESDVDKLYKYIVEV